MAQLATINPLNQFFALNGSPLNNGKLYFGEINKDPGQYPVQMYWDEAGLVPALQPIRTTSGYPSRSGSPAILYCAVQYSLLVSQSNDVVVFYLPKAGSRSLQEFGEWPPTDVTPSFASVNTFTMTGDQTGDFQPNRRARFEVTAGTVYGRIVSAVYGALTTVTMDMDGASVLDAGLSTVDLSILTATNPAIPETDTGKALRTAASESAARTVLGAVGWDLVSSQTALPSATIDFTGLSGSDDDYMIRLENVIPATNDAVLYCRVSQAAAFKSDATYSYNSSLTAIAGGAPSGGVASGTATQAQISGGVNNTTAEGGASGQVDLFNLSGTASYKHNAFKTQYHNSVSGASCLNGSFTYRGSSAAIDGIRFLFNSGNIASGTFLLYKLRKS